MPPLTVHKGRILVVDDRVNWRDLIASILESDYDVDLFSNVEGAMRAIETFDFDVAVLDVRLVQEDRFNVQGLALLAAIRKKHPDAGIIILTGYPEDIRPQVLQEYKANAFYTKGMSFDYAVFKEKVRALVDRRKVA
jgi:DNA-binding NtrC family response regulator